MATLESIIKEDAAYCRNVQVQVERRLGTVLIKDETGEQKDIFMQGDDASRFIQEMEELVEEAPDVLFEDAMKHLARPYVDCIWH